MINQLIKEKVLHKTPLSFKGDQKLQHDRLKLIIFEKTLYILDTFKTKKYNLIKIGRKWHWVESK